LVAAGVHEHPALGALVNLAMPSRTVPLPRFVAVELAAGVDGKRPDDLVFTMPGGSVMRWSNWRLVTCPPALVPVSVIVSGFAT